MRVGPAPSNPSDVEFSYAAVAKPACLSAPFCQVSCAGALVRGLLACDPVEGGFFWTHGSAYLRVHGRTRGACVMDIGIDIEGDVAYYRCATPLPVHAWPGLSYLDERGRAATDLLDGLDQCSLITRCSVVPGGPDPCDLSQSGAPTCPDLPSPC